MVRLLDDERARVAVEVMGLYADGEATEGDRRPAYQVAQAGYNHVHLEGEAFTLASNRARAIMRSWWAVVHLAEGPWRCAWDAADAAAEAVALLHAACDDWDSPDPAYNEAFAKERACQAYLLHDIFGNPFRPAALDSAWRTPTVVSLAQTAYDERTLPAGTLDPDRLAVLADALEDAGCDNADILSHLRGEGPHVRGCWVVDLLLGKG